MTTDVGGAGQGATAIPVDLAAPAMLAGRAVAKVLLDLTVYLRGPSETELAWLIDSYRGLCPVARQVKFKIAEFGFWPMLAKPPLTASGREAQRAGLPDAQFEPVRRRLREHRAFELQLWDGCSIDDPRGSWSFNCQRVLRRHAAPHSFVRIQMPLCAPADRLAEFAAKLADNVAFVSGHAGLAFTYDPWFIASAFDAIYAKAKRYWGVDIEDLNETLPLINDRIKGVNWLTMVSNELLCEPGVGAGVRALSLEPVVVQLNARHGCVLRAGTQPVCGDQNLDRTSISPYRTVAKALAPLFLNSHPPFPGPRFIDNNNTVAWLRRFLEPDAWRG